MVDWSDAEKVLCVRLDNLGDVLMTTPAIRALKHARPGRRLTLLASPSGAALASMIPDIDACIAYDAPWVKNDSAADADTDLAFIERLRAERFDAAVIFTVYTQSALPAAMLCRLAGIPRVLAHCRENPYRLITDWQKDSLPLDGGRHEVQRQLDLVASVGAVSPDVAMGMQVSDQDRNGLAQILQARGVTDLRRCVLVHPGATAASRRYPPERFAQVVAALTAEPGLDVLVTGGRSEQPLVAGICAAAGGRAIDLSGQLTLGQMAALVAGASVLISNNSGPVHIAAAVGTPVVDLYAQTNLQHTPWQVEHRLLFKDVPCKNCYRSICPEGHHLCLTGVAPAEVVTATHELRAMRVAAPESSGSGRIAA